MSTPDPLAGLALPYTVTFYPGVETTYMYPDMGQRDSGINAYREHSIGPGSYMIQVIYLSSGINLRLRYNGEDLYTFESGQTGWLTSPALQLAVGEGEEGGIRLQSTTLFPSDRGEVAAVNIYPMSTYQP